MTSLVILAASVFEISCGKTNTHKQTNKQMYRHMNAAHHPTHATAADMGQNVNDDVKSGQWPLHVTK